MYPVPLGHSKVYYWDMSYARMFGALICRCDVPQCNRVWISEAGTLPRRCARCKSMKWDDTKPLPEARERLKGDSVRNPDGVISDLPSARQFNDASLQSTPIGGAHEDELADEPKYVRDEWSQD
jgi:hypothetical protein